MPKKTVKDLTSEVQELRAQLDEARETLNAIRRGEIDGLVVSTPKGEQIYTLSGAETPYRLLIEEMKEGALMISDDNTIVYANKGFAKIVKHPLVEIVGKNVEMIVAPVHLSTFKEILYLSRAKKEVVENQIALKAKDNSLVPVHVSVALLTKNDPKTTLLIATDLTQHMEEQLKNYTLNLEREIAERKKAEEALGKSEQRWATTLASIGDAVIATDVSGKITFMNGEAEELTGWVLGEASQKPVKTIFNIINEQSRLEVENPIDRVLKEGMVVGLANHTVLIRKDGAEVPIDDSGAPIKDKEGKTTGVVLVFRDIAERKKAEEKTRQQTMIQEGTNRIFQEALSINTEKALGEVCLLVAEEVTQSKFGFIGDLNKEGFEDIAISNPGWDACKPINSKGHEAPIGSFKIHGIYGKVISEGKGFYTNDPANFPGRVMFPVGHPPVKSFLGVPLVSGGKIIGIVALGNREGGYGQSELEALEALAPAIVEAFLRKRAEKSLEEYKNNLEGLVEERTKQLKDSERLAAIGATAGMVGHDIRNPLQAITGDVFLAKTDLDAFPESEEKNRIQESLLEIEKNVDYINKIVADLQDFARSLKPSLEETDIKFVIDELLKKNGLPENVKVSVNVESDARKVVADSTFINRIMYNLVNNANQAMPKGGELTIHAYKEENDVVISVKDTGVGIPEAVKGKLFTPMFTTKAKGQGFGLAVIKRMTEALGGTVTFESQEGKGTTFTVCLPVQKVKRVN